MNDDFNLDDLADSTSKRISIYPEGERPKVEHLHVTFKKIESTWCYFSAAKYVKAGAKTPWVKISDIEFWQLIGDSLQDLNQWSVDEKRVYAVFSIDYDFPY